jgi:hypothetical protein
MSVPAISMTFADALFLETLHRLEALVESGRVFGDAAFCTRPNCAGMSRLNSCFTFSGDGVFPERRQQLKDVRAAIFDSPRRKAEMSVTGYRPMSSGKGGNVIPAQRAIVGCRPHSASHDNQ